MTDLHEKKILLGIEEVLAGYLAVSKLYPHTPSLSMWRAWEYAAYRRYHLPEPILDIGCGDGQFFRIVWPESRHVIGIDIELGTVQTAKLSGVYNEVHLAPAHDMPFGPDIFSSAFANCSLEHMDNLHAVLESIQYSLKQGGTFLMSVVTDKFIEWATLRLLIASICGLDVANHVQHKYLSFHHLVNPLTPEVWAKHLEAAGFDIIEYIPIIPEVSGRFFLLLDNIWHIKKGDEEIGNSLHRFFSRLPDFAEGFRNIVRGLLVAEKDMSTCCGAVFYLKKRKK